LIRKYMRPPIAARATIAHPTPIPACALTDKPELVCEVGVLVLVGEEEVEEGDDGVVLEGDEADVEERDFEVLVGAEVDMVAPDGPSVKTSVFCGT
jgi:hypothetical protein